jgi:hypothetical protein
MGERFVANRQKTVSTKLVTAKDYNLQEMLEYKRPDGSKYQTKFCNRYLRPVMDGPDLFGNYIKIIGDKPNVAFMAHHDTVHRETGKQTVINQGGFYKVDPTGSSNCLGADCTTGVYIILKMIEAGMPGVYVVHGAEEIGCIGSQGMVASNPDWINHVDVAISFDRKGYQDIITHQLGIRTCSDEFADSLAKVLDMDYIPDDGGVYTDSNEYRGVIAECTNISVGYFSQHSKAEMQDINFLNLLVDQILKADWSSLVVKRDPSVEEYSRFSYPFKPGSSYSLRYTEYDNTYEDPVGPTYTFGVKRDDKTRDPEYKDLEDMEDMIRNNPREVARILKDYGIDAYDLVDEIYNYKRTPEFEDEYVGF